MAENITQLLEEKEIELDGVHQEAHLIRCAIRRVKKSDGTYRMCVDLRAVNAVTISSAWPMPMLEAVLQSLEGSTCYATLDLWKGYWQFPLAEHAREIHSLMTDKSSKDRKTV